VAREGAQSIFDQRGVNGRARALARNIRDGKRDRIIVEVIDVDDVAADELFGYTIGDCIANTRKFCVGLCKEMFDENFGSILFSNRAWRPDADGCFSGDFTRIVARRRSGFDTVANAGMFRHVFFRSFQGNAPAVRQGRTILRCRVTKPFSASTRPTIEVPVSMLMD
jgi:hypothetical protein